MITAKHLASVALFAAAAHAGAGLPPTTQGAVFTLETQYFAETDAYYTVNITLDGQTLPVLLDTGSGDLLVVSNDCNTVNQLSGCYLVKPYEISDTTDLLDEDFFTYVGLGYISGVDSIQNVSMAGHPVLNDLAVPLVNYSATSGEFQDGQMAGIMGLNTRNVSRNWYFNHRLPLVDKMLKENKLAEPLFSITLPRYGDPDSIDGTLTFGGIPDIPAAQNLSYSDIIDTLNYNYQPPVNAPQGWTVQLTGIRMNGNHLPLDRGSLDPEGRYLSFIDSGSSLLSFRYYEINNITANINGPQYYDPDSQLTYFECAEPQLLELQYDDMWFPIDPLDIILPGVTMTINETLMCAASLGEWDRTFGDSINGGTFLKNALTVFDYGSNDALSVQPRLGLAPLTDAAVALKRYSSLYQNRL